MATQFNALNAIITDLAVVSSHFSSSRRSDDSAFNAKADVTCHKPEVSKGDNNFALSAKTTISVATFAAEEDNPFFEHTVDIGCTIICPRTSLAGDEADCISRLHAYAIDASVGYARGYIRDKSLTSLARYDLLLPPIDAETIIANFNNTHVEDNA